MCSIGLIISMPSMKGNSFPMMERIRECNIHILCGSKVLGLKSIHISNKKTDFGSLKKGKICTYEEKNKLSHQCFFFPAQTVFKPMLSDPSLL